MAIPEDKTTLNFVLDKSLKYKLQVLADADKRKLGNYVAQILQQHVEDFETKLVENYGFDDNFSEIYESFFGNEYPPYIIQEEIKFDPDDMRRKLNNIIRNSAKRRLTLGELKRHVADEDKNETSNE